MADIAVAQDKAECWLYVYICHKTHHESRAAYFYTNDSEVAVFYCTCNLRNVCMATVCYIITQPQLSSKVFNWLHNNTKRWQVDMVKHLAAYSKLSYCRIKHCHCYIVASSYQKKVDKNGLVLL